MLIKEMLGFIVAFMMLFLDISGKKWLALYTLFVCLFVSFSKIRVKI